LKASVVIIARNERVGISREHATRRPNYVVVSALIGFEYANVE
jgi:3-isopropylmalate dehydratase small subunit